MNKEDLGRLRGELIEKYRQINLQMGICIFDAIQCKEKTRLSRKYPDYAGDYTVHLFFIQIKTL